MPRNFGSVTGPSEQDLNDKWKDKVIGPFIVHKVMAANFRPHHFMIGTRHVTHASKHCGGMLGEATLSVIPCCAPQCGQLARDHHFDMIMVLKLTKDCLNSEAQAALKPICDEVDADKIDGFAFLESEFEFIKDS